MRHGMTLLETLLALVLLGSLAIASAGLVQLASGAASARRRCEPWRVAADAALDAVARDISTGDFDIGPDFRRVEVRAGRLTVVTRAISDGTLAKGGPVVHEYRLDPATATLWRDERPVSSRRGAPPGRVERSRLLVGGVDRWSASIDGTTGTLRVSISGSASQLLERSLRTR